MDLGLSCTTCSFNRLSWCWCSRRQGDPRATSARGTGPRVPRPIRTFLHSEPGSQSLDTQNVGLGTRDTLVASSSASLHAHADLLHQVQCPQLESSQQINAINKKSIDGKLLRLRSTSTLCGEGILSSCLCRLPAPSPPRRVCKVVRWQRGGDERASFAVMVHPKKNQPPRARNMHSMLRNACSKDNFSPSKRAARSGADACQFHVSERKTTVAPSHLSV